MVHTVLSIIQLMIMTIFLYHTTNKTSSLSCIIRTKWEGIDAQLHEWFPYSPPAVMGNSLYFNVYKKWAHN